MGIIHRVCGWGWIVLERGGTFLNHGEGGGACWCQQLEQQLGGAGLLGGTAPPRKEAALTWFEVVDSPPQGRSMTMCYRRFHGGLRSMSRVRHGAAGAPPSNAMCMCAHA